MSNPPVGARRLRRWCAGCCWWRPEEITPPQIEMLLAMIQEAFLQIPGAQFYTTQTRPGTTEDRGAPSAGASSAAARHWT